jgi:hypothetical protein
MLRKALAGLGVVASLIGAPAWGTDNYTQNQVNLGATAIYTFGDAGGSTHCADSSGLGNTGTISGGTTFNQAALAPGLQTTSATLNSGSGCTLPYTSSGPLATVDYTGKFYMEAWVVVPNTTTQYKGMAVALKETGAPTGWNWYFAYNNGCGPAGSQMEMAISFAQGGFSSQYWAASNVSFTAGTIHHVAISWDYNSGSPIVKFYVDSIDRGTTVCQNNFTGSAATSAAPVIASAGVPAGIQSFAFYPGTSHPAGILTAAGPSGQDMDNLSFFNWYSEGQNNGAPFTNPPLGVHFGLSDDQSDPDWWGDYLFVMWLAQQQHLRLDVVGSDAGIVNGPSAYKALLDYWGQSNTQVISYQTASPQADSFGANSDMAATFRSQDATLAGIILPVITGGGTAYQVGDILTLSGGTQGSFGVGGCPWAQTAAQYEVDAVSSGVITAGHFLWPGCYTTTGTVPASPATLPNPHSGAGATITFTAQAKNGLYRDYTNLGDILKTTSNVWYTDTGQSYGLNSFFSNYTGAISIWNSQVAAFAPVNGWNPSNAYFSKGAEFNWVHLYTQWASILPNMTVPLVITGDENQLGGPKINPAGAQVHATISGTSLTINSVQTGTVAIGEYLQANYGSHIKIASGSGTSWTLSGSASSVSNTAMVLTNTDPLVDPLAHAWTHQTFYTFPYALPSYSSALWPMLASGGIVPNGSGYQLYSYYGGLSGNFFIDNGSGANCWTPSTASSNCASAGGSWVGYQSNIAHFIRRRATDAQYATLFATVAAGTPQSALPRGMLTRGIGALFPANDNLEQQMRRLVAGR